MREPIIEIKNLGKKYNIAHQQGGYIALRDVITNIFKNPFRFAKSKAKQIAGLEKKEIFWALDDINLTIEPGEVVGVIGRNGAGKSTLLKILSQITPPTTGEIIINGTLGSLLEVGTGFHPELTGRENIMLNGAILGMSKKEIIKKFDAIVEFAGISKFLDTPVKYYSSGMYVRLAFSVAAHLEPDILLVDEVLAVGDAEFQNKCLGKMDEITKEEGRTILFVSHNLSAIASLCKKTIVLDGGKIIKYSDTQEAINFYQNNSKNLDNIPDSISINNGELVFNNFLANSVSCQKNIILNSAETLELSFIMKAKKEDVPINVGFGFRQKNGNLSVFTHAQLENFFIKTKKEAKISATFDMPRLSPGDYFIEFHVWINDKLIITEKVIGVITIPETQAFQGGQFFSSFPSSVMTDSKWELKLSNKI